MNNGDSPSDRRPAEERAEEVMERVAGDASRKLGRFLGRAREEFEDIVAEARSLNERREPTRSKPPSELPSRSDDGR
jgi:hypothetical protein